MTEKKPPAKKTVPAAKAAPAPAAVESAPVTERRACNVPECRREPTNRGLCDGHYASKRGYADRR